jgi:uncharacterized phage protein gp47/JayE
VPDLTDYNSLVLYDSNPADLVERAIADATVKLPDWVPAAGNTEMVLIEAMALQVAELVYAINRLPDGVLDVLLRLFGVTRSLGIAPTATATFTASVTSGVTVPAGTVVRLNLGSNTVDFTTDSTAAVPVGATTIVVPITGTLGTSDANGSVAGAVLELESSVALIDTVTLATDVAAGTDPETDAAWRKRAIETFQRLTTTLVLPDHFTAAAIATPGVARAFTIDNYDGTGSNPGHVTVAVIGSGGALLSSGDKTALQADLDAQSQANLAVHVIDPTVTTVPVTTAVHLLPGYDLTTVTSNIQTVLEGYLSPDTWGWGGTVRKNELIARIDGAEGVDYVSTITAPATDVSLSGAAPLAALGTLTVTAV